MGIVEEGKVKQKRGGGERGGLLGRGKGEEGRRRTIREQEGREEGVWERGKRDGGGEH